MSETDVCFRMLVEVWHNQRNAVRKDAGSMQGLDHATRYDDGESINCCVVAICVGMGWGIFA